MTDNSLLTALQGLNVTGADTPWGIGAMGLAQSTPLLMNPYASWQKNLLIGLGGNLVTALLGYQAKQSAMEQNLALQPYITQALKAPSMEALDTIMAQEDAAPLRSIGTQLKMNLLENQAAAAKRKADLEDAVKLSLAKEYGIIPNELTGSITMPAPGTLSYKDLQDIEKQKRLKAFEKSLSTDEAGGLTGQQRDEYDAMRREFNSNEDVKKFSYVSTAAETVAKAAQDPSAVAVSELTKRAVQLIEPGLAALQGETDAIKNSSSIPEAWKSQLNQALTGQGGLGPDVREGIIRLAKRSYEAQATKYEQARSFYQNELNSRNIPRDISWLGASKPFEYYLQNAGGNTTPPPASGVERLAAIQREIKTVTDPAKRSALQKEAQGIYEGLKSGR